MRWVCSSSTALTVVHPGIEPHISQGGQSPQGELCWLPATPHCNAHPFEDAMGHLHQHGFSAPGLAPASEQLFLFKG